MSAPPSSAAPTTLQMADLRRLLEEGLRDAPTLADDRGHPLAPGRLAPVQRIAQCGDPHDGFVWLRCAPCGVDRVVALSCKSAVLCPRCGGRRMAQTAAHLTDDVLPEVRLRQWVVTFPQPLPRLLAWRPDLLRRVLALVSRRIEAHLRVASGRPDGRAGLVQVVQTFTGDLRRYVHVHALVPEAVAVEEGDGTVRLVPARPPRREELVSVAEGIGWGLVRLGRRWASSLDEEDAEAVGESMLDALGRLGEEAEGARVPRSQRPPARVRRWLAEALGVQVHAGVAVSAGDREGRERLCRYVARPALSQKRLTRLEDGRVAIRFKSAWRSGQTGVRLRPDVFVLRLASLALPRGVNTVRFFGYFAPASPLRSRVVPSGRASPARRRRRRWIPWAELLWRVFGREADVCPRCGSKMAWQATILSPVRAWEVLSWVSRHGELARDGPGV